MEDYFEQFLNLEQGDWTVDEYLIDSESYNKYVNWNKMSSMI